MKTSELKKLIKEEVHSALNEGKKYLNDMSYEELIALRKRMDFKKASREEKKYVKDLIDKKKPLDEVADKLVQKEIRSRRNPKLKSSTPEDIADDLKIYFQIAFEKGLESSGSYDNFEKEFWDGEYRSIIDKIKDRFHRNIRVI
jgi:hypothetical protein